MGFRIQGLGVQSLGSRIRGLGFTGLGPQEQKEVQNVGLPERLRGRGAEIKVPVPEGNHKMVVGTHCQC